VQAELFEKLRGLEAEVERVRLEEGGRKKEGEEYQTHLEEELAESQAQRAALLEEGSVLAAKNEEHAREMAAQDAAKVRRFPGSPRLHCSLRSWWAELRWAHRFHDICVP
jgi:hypothetical protein